MAYLDSPLDAAILIPYQTRKVQFAHQKASLASNVRFRVKKSIAAAAAKLNNANPRVLQQLCQFSSLKYTVTIMGSLCSLKSLICLCKTTGKIV
jgi:hypothetical protein